MPRPERALDPSSGIAGDFAADLRLLRRSAGTPSYRKMATAGRYSPATLADAAAGRRLPALPVVLHYVHACGGDLDEWEARWRSTARRIAAERHDDASEPSPYRGLAAFGAADADRFFGRELLVERLVERVRGPGLTLVTGASGSGKSSLLRAGLVPAVERAGGTARVCTPGPDPAARLSAATTADDAGAGPAVLVFDQIEEVFTLCQDPAARRTFLDGLLTAAQRHPVVAAVRADFLTRCAAHAGLARTMAGGTVVVGAMDPDGLRRAVTEPARNAGLSVERALVAQVLADVEDQPGALALVSHALLETWRHRQGTVLTLAGYRAAGGVDGAVADTAERVYAALTAGEQQAARHLLVRLTTLGEGIPDTRRRVDRGELDLPGAGAVVDRFAAARLVVVDADTVEFAHEAVITAWPRLAGWLAEDREALRVHRRLTEAAAVWQSLDRDPGALYRGARLALAREWAAPPGRRDMLTAAETEFLDAGLAAEATERATAARRARLLRRLTAALTCLLLLATALAGTALWQWRVAEDERRQALSRQRAAEAVGLARTDVAEALRLAVGAHAVAPTVEARGALLGLAARRAFSGRLQHTGPVRDLVFSPDGGTLAAAEMTGRVVLWDTARRTPRRTLSGHDRAVRALAYRPDGGVLVGTVADGSVTMWNPHSGARLRTFRGHEGVADAVAFAPDGRTFATTGRDRRIRLWSAVDGARVGELTGSGGSNAGLAYTPDGRHLVSAGDADTTVTVWDVARLTRVRTLDGGEPLHTVAVSPDGALVAAAGQGRTVQVWSLQDGRRTARLPGHTAVVSTVRFAGPATVFTAGHDGRASLWDARKGRQLTVLPGSTSSLFGAAVSPDGRTFAAGGRDRSVLLWERTTMPLAAHTDEVSALGVAPDGRFVVSADRNGAALLWHVGTGSPAVADRGRDPVPLPGASAATDIAVAPDGRHIAAAGTDRTVHLWQTDRPRRPGSRLTGHTDLVLSVAFHPQGRLLASSGADRTVRLWDLPAGTLAATLAQPAAVHRVVFSPDGTRFVSAAEDGTVTVWDTAVRRPVGTVTDRAGVLDLALRPDGRTAAVARADGAITVWDLPDRRVVTTLRGHRGPVSAVRFSPDGRILASGGYDEEVVLWQAPQWRTWARLRGHGADVISITWSPDGQVLYTGSTDHTITPWWMDPATARAAACADLIRAFPGTRADNCPAGG